MFLLFLAFFALVLGFFWKFELERERATERDERAGEGRKGPVATRLQGRPCAPGPAVLVVSRPSELHGALLATLTLSADGAPLPSYKRHLWPQVD